VILVRFKAYRASEASQKSLRVEHVERLIAIVFDCLSIAAATSCISEMMCFSRQDGFLHIQNHIWPSRFYSLTFATSLLGNL